MIDNFTTYPDCSNGEVGLAGGSSVKEGRVEICVNGTWVTVCYNTFNVIGALIVCTHLGFSALGELVQENV